MKYKSKRRNILYTLLIIIVISNTPIAAFFVAPSYHYQTLDHRFRYVEEPGKGMDFEVLKIRYARFRQENPQKADTKLYRTFTIKPWQFWQWWEMIVRNERFRLPHLDRTR